MDWRLIGAISAAGGSFCVVAAVAYIVLTANPAQQQSSAAPILLSDYRFPTAAPPSLLRVEPAAARPFAPQGNAASVIVASNAAIAPVARTTGAAPPGNPSRITGDSSKSPHGRVEPKPEPRVTGYKTAALTPFDAGPRSEPPPRPVVEVKKSSVVPEVHAALPTTRYRGVLTSAEIIRIKHNLRLTPDQEPAWPSVEAALAEMGRQQITLLRHGQEPRLSQSDWPPGRLYAVAGPLLRVLRPDQKDTVRRLCRSLGFEGVASMI
jgi:hypothetical protein